MDAETPAYGCQHRSYTRPRKRVLSNGKTTYWRQCLDCGNAFGLQFSVREALRLTGGKPAKFDEELQQRKRLEEREHYRIQTIQRKREWFEWYNEYLKTDQWREKRWQVLERCGHLCEGCRIETATVVHHLTYAHVGNELLFELVGLCDGCHTRTHGSSDYPRPYTFLMDADDGDT